VEELELSCRHHPQAGARPVDNDQLQRGPANPLAPTLQPRRDL
jgi:hypothetical protein